MSGIPSAEVFQAIVDRIDSGVYAVDLEGKISYWNYGAEKISGFLSQEVLGRACRDSILVEYDDHNPVMCVHHCPLEGVRNGSRQEAMTYLRHRAGHVVPVRLWTMALKDRTGNIVGAVKVFSEKIAVPDLREETSQARVEDLDAESGVPSRVSTETFCGSKSKLAPRKRRSAGLSPSGWKISMTFGMGMAWRRAAR
jgi:PAS domain S-box-containing protein